MSGDWSLIFRGFAVAAIGATATILYIIALSAAFVGRFVIAGAAVAAGVILAITFLRLIGRYLDAIDRRDASESLLMKPQGDGPATVRARSGESP